MFGDEHRHLFESRDLLIQRLGLMKALKKR